MSRTAVIQVQSGDSLSRIPACQPTTRRSNDATALPRKTLRSTLLEKSQREVEPPRRGDAELSDRSLTAIRDFLRFVRTAETRRRGVIQWDLPHIATILKLGVSASLRLKLPPPRAARDKTPLQTKRFRLDPYAQSEYFAMAESPSRGFRSR